MEIGFLQEIKAIIKSLVVSYPQQISIDKLNKDFAETEGYSIPYGKLGFKNLESFLRSISDTVKIQGHGSVATVHYVANQKANHIHDMIKSQKKSRPRPRTKNSRPMSYNQAFITKPERQGNDASNSRLVSNSAVKRQDRRVNNFSLNDIIPHAAIFNDNYNKNRTANYKNNLQTQIPHVSKSNYVPPKKPITDIIQEKELIHEEVAKKKTVNTVDKEKESSQKKIVSINPKEEVIEAKRAFELNKTKIVLNAKEICDSKSYENNPAELKKIADITDKFTDSVNITSQQYSDISDKKRYLTIEENDKESDSHNTDFFKLSSSSKDNFDDMDEAVPLFAANNLVFRLDFPENTVVFGKKIKPFTLPSDIKKGSIIGIFISEIHNPFKFWFHIHKENHQLDFLMHNIERFYNSLDSDEFVIPLTCHTPGQICAALYNNLWHRAEIIGNPINNQTKVFFLDYGTVSDVSVDNIKYLASMFATIPSQAVRGCLSHIKPRGLHWTHEATKYFLSIVCELMLYGQVTEIDEQVHVLCFAYLKSYRCC